MINLPAVLIANGLAAGLMVMLLVSSSRIGRSALLDDRLFFVLCLLTLFLSLTEAAVFCLDGVLFPGAILLARLLNTLLFVFNGIFSVLWVLYMDYKLFGRLDRIRRFCLPVSLPAAVLCLFSLANLFTDVFFSISPENIYSRTPLAVIPYLFTYGYLLLGGAMAIRHRKQAG